MGATSPCGEIDQHSPNFGVQTQTWKSLELLGWDTREHPQHGKKKSWKSCKTK